MIKYCRLLGKNEEFESRIKFLCSFNNAKYEIEQGKVLNVNDTNVSIIVPHQIIIKIKDKKLMLLYFNGEDSMFLYNRYFPVDFKQLKLVLKEMRGKIDYE